MACYIRRWYTRPKTVTHPSTNRSRLGLTSFMRRTPLTTTPRRQPPVTISMTSHKLNCNIYSPGSSRYYITPGRGGKYCDQPFCMSIGLHVCPHAYLRLHMSNLHHSLCTRCWLKLWLGPSPMHYAVPVLRVIIIIYYYY